MCKFFTVLDFGVMNLSTLLRWAYVYGEALVLFFSLLLVYSFACPKSVYETMNPVPIEGDY